ncbi:hypothetical protein N8H74_20000 [Pseudomonas sp. B2M1-30]|uniref:hypothetical protein n=1 Tax=Pseudomonas TaxID=286 RepID=UPI0021CA82C9|nr:MULTISPECIES: hypothetical protein [Pseudomonas]MCU0120551.1 hypothetical protein [Pseudomonas sp. B2M1-30]MCU7262569.1 hypothetical protein [Pseudomonas koreensis]
MEIKLSDVIAAISMIVSVGAVYFARASSKNANLIAQENLNLQSAMVETGISQSIEGAKAKINEVSVVMVPLVVKENADNISIEEAANLVLFRKIMASAEQSLVNHYDFACSKYIDGKVDKIRFKKSYRTEIRQLVESQDFQEHFNPVTSTYKPILMVYKEWEDLESQS